MLGYTGPQIYEEWPLSWKMFLMKGQVGELCSHSVVSDSLQPPWTAACQASLSIISQNW